MTTIETSRWLFVAIAVIGLALAVPLVSAHDTDTTNEDPRPYNGTDAPPHDGTAEEWEHWMERQMTEHMGPGSVELMESHMGVTIEEMAEDMADREGHATGYGMHDDGVQGNDYGMADQGHGC